MTIMSPMKNCWKKGILFIFKILAGGAWYHIFGQGGALSERGFGAANYQSIKNSVLNFLAIYLLPE